MELSHLADLIIVGCFFGCLGGMVGHCLGRFTVWIAGKVVKWREKHRKVEIENGDNVEQ